MGLKKHSKMIASYLDNDSPSLVVASIKSLRALNAREYEEKLMKMRDDKRVVSTTSNKKITVANCIEEVLKEWKSQDYK
ncbi:MAG: hypothetical protein HY606_10780 [Planctomycetes bacterium]|nr:hypothetical protein [Planctomycetota bacterium]